MKSCPSRGTWIEMPRTMFGFGTWTRRAPRGARGLKSVSRIDESSQKLVVPLAGHVD